MTQAIGICLLLALPLCSTAHAEAMRVEAELGYLDSERKTLVVIRSGKIEELAVDATLSSLREPTAADQSHELSHSVSRIMPDSQGGLWMVGRSDISRWHPEDGLCTVDGTFNDIGVLYRHEVRETLEISDEFYLDGTGVLGQHYSVDTQCRATSEAAYQPYVTVIVSDADNDTVTEVKAFSALVEAGPETVQAPFVEIWNADNKLREFHVLSSNNQSSKVTDMQIVDDRLLLLGDSGIWELWDIVTSSLILTGESQLASTSIVALSHGGPFVVIGDTMIDMENSTSVKLGLNGELLGVDHPSGSVLLRRDNTLIIDQNL